MSDDRRSTEERLTGIGQQGNLPYWLIDVDLKFEAEGVALLAEARFVWDQWLCRGLFVQLPLSI